MDSVARQLRPQKKQPISFDNPRVMQPDVKWVSPGGGASISRLGTRAEADSAGGAVLTNAWMPTGRNARIWQVVLQPGGELQPETALGIVGRNFAHPSNWNTPLDASKHAVCVRVSDGVLVCKGRATLLKLRPLLRGGMRLRLTVDMQLLALTFEVLGEGSRVLGALTVDTDVPVEVTAAVGFAPVREEQDVTDGAAACASRPQSVKLLSVTAQEPDALGALPTKLVKDLWDDDAVVMPLHLQEAGRHDRQHDHAYAWATA